MNDIQRIFGVRVGNGVEAWCPRCMKLHFHGCFGTKTAHCGDEEPYEVVELDWPLEQWRAAVEAMTPTKKQLRALRRRQKR